MAKYLLPLMWVMLMGFQHGFSCVDFLLKCQDDSYINGRSLEFGLYTPAHIEIHPRGEKKQSLGPNNQKGWGWTSKYAYLALAAFTDGLVVDGFNEKGMTFNVLWFPDGKYPPIPTNGNAVIDFIDLGAWILGNFSSIDDVKQTLKKLQIYFHEIPQMHSTPPVHMAIHDMHGKSIVIEFIEGKMEVFDNIVGVLTNSPAFPWHVTNLRNYINMSAVNSAPEILDGLKLLPTGQGTGLRGIPGDWTPPSRFIRVALFKEFIKPPKDVQEGVNAAFHILNTVDIPYGSIKNKDDTDPDYTQWVSVADLKNKKLYVRTYKDLNIQTVDLNSTSLHEGEPVKKIPIGPY